MKPETRAILIKSTKERAEREALEFFHDHLREAWATVPVGTHRENWPIRSRDFRLWVTQTLYDLMGGTAPPQKLVKEIIYEFETHAVCRGKQYEVFVRVAGANGNIYIDLGDSSWRAVEITRDGWLVVAEPPVKFFRKMGQAALPIPQRGGKLRLGKFLNVKPRNEILVLTWLSYCLRPGGPFLILALLGVQGAGKSTATRVLRSLVDPSIAALVTSPQSERDLAIAASGSHLLCLDNLSEITPTMSDAMCRICTGGSFRRRKLYTDADEVIFTYKRPLIVNGIEELPQRSDLLDRSLLIRLEAIGEERRRAEVEFWNEFNRFYPQFFGALLDTVSAGLRRAGSVSLPTLPRMADFAQWGVAIEESLGYAAGSFLAAYKINLEDVHATAVEASPVAGMLRELVLARGSFYGSALQLLKTLNEHVSETAETARKHPRWPKAANALSGQISRVAPNLRKLGIEVEIGKRGKRFISLKLAKRGDNGVVSPGIGAPEPAQNEADSDDRADPPI